MMARLMAPLLLGIVALALGVGAFVSPDGAAGPRTAGASSPVELAPGAAVDLGDARLRFSHVVSDSRCPMDAICIQAGEAVVALTYERAGEIERLEVTLRDAAVVEVGGNRIAVQSLEPYPMASRPTAPEDYRLIVAIASN